MTMKEKVLKKLEKWQSKRQMLKLKQQIKKEKRELKEIGRKKITTTKFLMYFLFLSCTMVEVFTLYITLHTINLGLMPDYGPLQMLITAVVSEVIGFAIYALKSTKENTKGGIVYQTAIMNQQQNNMNTQEAQGQG